MTVAHGRMVDTAVKAVVAREGVQKQVAAGQHHKVSLAGYAAVVVEVHRESRQMANSHLIVAVFAVCVEDTCSGDHPLDWHKRMKRVLEDCHRLIEGGDDRMDRTAVVPVAAEMVDTGAKIAVIELADSHRQKAVDHSEVGSEPEEGEGRELQGLACSIFRVLVVLEAPTEVDRHHKHKEADSDDHTAAEQAETWMLPVKIHSLDVL